jgi:hypothetical protein
MRRWQSQDRVGLRWSSSNEATKAAPFDENEPTKLRGMTRWTRDGRRRVAAKVGLLLYVRLELTPGLVARLSSSTSVLLTCPTFFARIDDDYRRPHRPPLRLDNEPQPRRLGSLTSARRRSAGSIPPRQGGLPAIQVSHPELDGGAHCTRSTDPPRRADSQRERREGGTEGGAEARMRSAQGESDLYKRLELTPGLAVCYHSLLRRTNWICKDSETERPEHLPTTLPSSRTGFARIRKQNDPSTCPPRCPRQASVAKRPKHRCSRRFEHHRRFERPRSPNDRPQRPISASTTTQSSRRRRVLAGFERL